MDETEEVLFAKSTSSHLGRDAEVTGLRRLISERLHPLSQLVLTALPNGEPSNFLSY